MRFLALQTNRNKIIESFCSPEETIVCSTYYHGLSFLLNAVRGITVTIIICGVFIITMAYELPIIWSTSILGIIWFFFAFFNILKAYIDWNFDRIIITTDKVILVDQGSIFRQEIKPIHLDNIGAISTDTQFFDILNFGSIVINLKEGLGGDAIRLNYVPNYKNIASHITSVVTKYQRHTRNNPIIAAQAGAQIGNSTQAIPTSIPLQYNIKHASITEKQQEIIHIKETHKKIKHILRHPKKS